MEGNFENAVKNSKTTVLCASYSGFAFLKYPLEMLFKYLVWLR